MTAAGQGSNPSRLAGVSAGAIAHSTRDRFRAGRAGLPPATKRIHAIAHRMNPLPGRVNAIRDRLHPFRGIGDPFAIRMNPTRRIAKAN